MHATRALAVVIAVVIGSGVSACSNDDAASVTTSSASPASATPSTPPPTVPTTVPTTVPRTVQPTVPETTPSSAPATTAAPTVPPTTATTEPSDSVPEPGSDAAYAELGEAALLDNSVFPSGWQQRPASEEDQSQSDRFADRVAECLATDGERVSEQLQARKVTSPEFAGPGEASPTVEQQIIVADDEATAIRAMEDVAVDGADACLQITIQEFFDEEAPVDVEAGVTLGDVTVERVDLESPPDLIVSYLVVLPVVGADGSSASGYLQVVYQRLGRALSQMQLSSFGTVFDPEGLRVLTAEVLTRLGPVGQ